MRCPLCSESLQDCMNFSRKDPGSLDKENEALRASSEQELGKARNAYTPQLFSDSEIVMHVYLDLLVGSDVNT